VTILSSLIGVHIGREDGQALVEYGLILSLVALVAIIGVTAMGSDVDGMYEVIRGAATAMADAVNG